MDSRELFKMIFGFVVSESRDEDGNFDVNEVNGTLEGLMKELARYMMKFELFTSLSKVIDECDGELTVMAIPNEQEAPQSFASFLQDEGYDLVDSDGDQVTDEDLNGLIDAYLEKVKASE